MARVVNLKYEKYDVFIGRGSIWGNPFTYLPQSVVKFTVDTREQAIGAYEIWILTQPHLLARLHTLKGKVLGCYCKPLACHGDVLVKLIKAKT
jgi:hypothetical protein